MDLLAGQVATTVANARAYEEERKRAEALAELDRAKTVFFSNVSHEFRTPLTLMLAPVEDALADTEESPTPRQQERLALAQRNALRLKKLVNTLLDFSRIEAGRIQASYEPTDLASLTAELASNFRSACEKAGIELRVDCPPLLEPVYVDQSMWEKIVLNLVSNAFKYTLEGSFEYPHETPGDRRWVSAIVYCIERLPSGRSRCSYVAEDVTERKRVEEALRQSEQRFARFMDHLPGLAWIKDLKGCYVYANDAAVRAFRGTRDALYGRTDDEIFPPETAAQFKQNDHKALLSEAGVQVIETLEQPDGIVHHSVVSKFPILGAGGNPALVGGMAIDVTDRLRAEKVLAESEERFRQLAENVNEIFWMTDPQTTQLLYISPAFERVWGRPCQTLYENPRSFMDAVHPDDRERVRIAVLENQSRGEQTDKEYRVVRPDGSIRWVRDRAFPVRNTEGQFYRLVGVIDDYTERKLAEEALKEADRRKDEFLATLAHELRNPLAPIRNSLQILKMPQARCGHRRAVTGHDGAAGPPTGPAGGRPARRVPCHAGQNRTPQGEAGTGHGNCPCGRNRPAAH